MTGPHAPNFNHIARPYRWLELFTFGPALHRCRTHFLPQLARRRRALVLGDGDGRFVARLLASNPDLHADAVDLSPTMLELLQRRARAAHPTAPSRLRTYTADARDFTPAGRYDLVVTHFFVDCLTEPELDRLLTEIRPHLTADALWLISDFRIPSGALHWPARALVRSLYAAFRVLTGLRTTRLPHHSAALSCAGFTRATRHLSLAGLLTTELWAFNSAAQPAYIPCMQLPPQKPRAPYPPDPVPDPEPASPSLPEPDPAVFHPTAPPPVKP